MRVRAEPDHTPGVSLQGHQHPHVCVAPHGEQADGPARREGSVGGRRHRAHVRALGGIACHARSGSRGCLRASARMACARGDIGDLVEGFVDHAPQGDGAEAIAFDG